MFFPSEELKELQFTAHCFFSSVWHGHTMLDTATKAVAHCHWKHYPCRERRQLSTGLPQNLKVTWKAT